MILGIIRDKSQGAISGQSDSETESENDEPTKAKQGKPIGWLYTGSHNFTPSAWGTLSGSAFNPTLNVSVANGLSS